MASSPNQPVNLDSESTGRVRSGRLIRRLSFAVPLGLILGWFAVATTVAQITRFDNPSLALKFVPYDAVANAVQADRILQGAKGKPGTATMTAFATRSLARSPLMPQAMRVLGFAADLDAKRSLARTRINFASTLSRRDTATQLWLIDDAVSREDVSGALDNFDIAMRTSLVARGILFPILGQAMADPEYVNPIAHVLNRKPNWMRDFLVTTLQKGIATDNVAVLVGERLLLDAPTSRLLAQAVVDQLIAERKFDQLHQFASGRFAKSLDIVTARGKHSIDDFSADNQMPGPLSWMLDRRAGIGAETEGKVLSIYADSGTEGLVASRLIFFGPGAKELLVVGTAVGGSGGVDLTVACAEVPNRPLITIQLSARVNMRVPFGIPSGCSAQWLKLVVRPTDDPRGVSARISGLSIITAHKPSASRTDR